MSTIIGAHGIHDKIAKHMHDKAVLHGQELELKTPHWPAEGIL